MTLSEKLDKALTEISEIREMLAAQQVRCAWHESRIAAVETKAKGLVARMWGATIALALLVFGALVTHVTGGRH